MLIPWINFGSETRANLNLHNFFVYSILLPLQYKQCPLTLASVLACADHADELRF